MAGILYKIPKYFNWYNKIPVLYNKIVVISVNVYFCNDKISLPYEI